MKKIIFLSFLLAGISTTAQNTVIFEDDFEAYTAGSYIAAQNNSWETWSGGSGTLEDAQVTDAVAANGSNSLHFTNERDIILPLGDRTTGRYTIEFNALILQGGTVNFMHTCRTNWAADIFFNDNSQITYVHEFSTLDGEVLGTYNDSTWIHFLFDIDIDNDISKLFLDGDEKISIAFSTSNNGITSNMLSCFDIYGVNNFGGVTTSEFYIDDFKFTEINTVATEELEETSPLLAPNPTESVVNIPSEVSSVTVYSMDGAQVLTSSENTVDLSAFESGIYLFEMSVGTQLIRERIVKM